MQQKRERQGIQPLSLEILPPPSEFSESCISDSPPLPLVVNFDIRKVSYCGRTNLKKKKIKSRMSDCRSVLVNSESSEPLRDGPKSINQDEYKLSSKLVRGLTRLLFYQIGDVNFLSQQKQFLLAFYFLNWVKQPEAVQEKKT